MEIGSFPLLNQEDYYHFHNLFQEIDFNMNDTSKKLRTKDENENDEVGIEENSELTKPTLRDVLSSLIMFDEEKKREEEHGFFESEQDKALFDSTHKQKTQAMINHNHQIQNHHSELDNMDRGIKKRARRSAFAVASAVSDNANAENFPATFSQTGGAQGGSTHHRRLWVKDRSKDWWERCKQPDYPEEQFRRDFRMSKATFDMICKELGSTVMKKDTTLREAIPVPQRVAVCIWRLATGEPLRLVSKRFGLGISTCHKLVLEVCSAIRTVLMPKFLQWPDETKMKKTKEEFEAISGIPNVGGSIYTTHLPIIAPNVNVSAYYNKRHTERNEKTSYSITVQGLVDKNGIFTDICIGWPGSLSDDQVLEKSALFERANRGLLKDVWMVGNSGFPLMDWVLVPYSVKNLTWTQHAFNEKVGEIQRVAKEAFGSLKGRWSCLQRRTEVKLQEVPVVLGACCVLHNICEMRNEKMDPNWRFEVFDDEMVAENGVRSLSSVQARDHIAHNLLHHGTSFL